MKAQLFTAVAAGALLAAMPAFAQKSKDTLRVAFAESINSADVDVDPKPETSFTGRSVFDSLIYYSADAAAFKPLLAKSWKRVNPTTIEFELRDDIKWHDGEPFDADDVVFTIKHVLDKKVKYRFKRNTLFIKNAEKLGKYKVRLTSKKLNPVDMARYAVSLRIRPQHAQSKFKNWQDFGSKNPVGTGPYKVVSLDSNKGLVLERSESYGHGKEAGLSAKIKRIHAIPIPDVQTQVAQMLAWLEDTTGLPVSFSSSSTASSERQAVQEQSKASASSRQILEANSTTLSGSWSLMPWFPDAAATGSPSKFSTSKPMASK